MVFKSDRSNMGGAISHIVKEMSLKLRDFSPFIRFSAIIKNKITSSTYAALKKICSLQIFY